MNKSDSAKNSHSDSAYKLIAQNKRASHDYFLLEKIECGIVLGGSEVKSLRDGHAAFSDSYARVQNGELKLLGLNISEYPMANRLNHQPLAPRKLLAHKREIRRLARAEEEKQLTIVPTKIYFKRGYAKVEIALAKGKAKYDKRENLKLQEFARHKQRVMNTRRR